MLTKQEAAKLISETNGQFFTVTFYKRSTGEERTMNCRLGVKKHLQGGEKRYSDKEKQLITVYSVDSKGYRTIPIEGLTQLKVAGRTYQVQ